MGLLLETNLYIILVVVWTASVIYRCAQKRIKQAVFLIGILLIGWSILNLSVNYPEVNDPDRINYIGYIIGFFVLLFIESVIRSGLFPVNTRYKAFFTHSPLSMRIVDNSMHTVFCSSSAVWYDYETFNTALSSYPEPAREDENTLLYAAPIKGGYALWQEDITALTGLNKEMEDAVNKLTAANALLAEEEKTKQAVQAEIEKTGLMEQLEAEISGHTIRLSTMIEQLENNVDKEKATARVVLLLCYIKRRCNLFFREKEGDTLPADELTVYFDELAEMAGYSGVRIIVKCELKKDIPVRHATLYYDLFYNVIYWTTWSSNPYILAMLGSDNGINALRLLPSEDARYFKMGRELQNAINSANGMFDVKELDDDAVGLSLAFNDDPLPEYDPMPERGENDDV